MTTLDTTDQAKKFCAKCDETKPLEDFWKNKTSKDGRQTYCKSCLKSYAPRKDSSRKYEQKYSRIRMADGSRRRVPKDLVQEVIRQQNADTTPDASGNRTQQVPVQPDPHST